MIITIDNQGTLTKNGIRLEDTVRIPEVRSQYTQCEGKYIESLEPTAGVVVGNPGDRVVDGVEDEDEDECELRKESQRCQRTREDKL